ncbi:aspartate 1-decarboxylase [Candidatus Neomarinimicrobiota bacterium]
MTLISILKSKIHRATVTAANLDYTGSISLDPNLMAAAGLVEYEKVLVADITNGNRLETYVIASHRGTGEVCMNGAAAHLVKRDDLIIVMSFHFVSTEEAVAFSPTIVKVDEQNQVVE